MPALSGNFCCPGDFLNNSEQDEISENNSDEDTEQLLLLLVNEMPVNYEKEALKAQAVIARTNLAYAREKDQAEPKRMTREEMLEFLAERIIKNITSF